MKRIGVTGHRDIPEAAYPHVKAALEEELTAALCGFGGGLEAYSSLAAGADQLFAGIALDCGAELTVVIPSGDYEEAFEEPGELARYQVLRQRATREVRMAFAHSTDEAYFAAGAYIADHCDALLAVWDGEPARGLGGTGDIVRYARERGRPVTVIWREGVRRG
ncbi:MULTISPECIES: hypothetical protein [Streptomyces]|uniref:DNA recombination-mediator protein A n=1 Tax=Streptomyces solicathayae TaxID=3081768 RepID=A0ABZ0M0P7_9ACTN|nr:hypothetical protein [Streptomyces sp. HUAS YS2]WOX25248.1 hypothetical protein R2D22_29280 [Streptomyces sp. HUAS YS2]